jgi:Rrf2 family nitric oxide-sensitive transcriptional repressor
MRLTQYTDYALRVLMYLGTRPDRFGTIEGIAAAYGISRAHVMKVAHDLAKLGYIETSRGRGGGLSLARPPHRIRLGEVIKATEPNLALAACFPSGAGDCRVAGPCALNGILNEALARFFGVLDRYTLADLVRRPERFQAALAAAPGAS